MKNILFYPVLLFSMHGFAQPQYNYYSGKDKQYFLKEEFNNNQNNWNISEDEDEISLIENGYLHLQSLSNGARTVVINQDVSQDRNFEIEASLKIVEEDKPGDLHLIRWGSGKNIKIDFGFNLKGTWGIVKYDENRPTGDKIISLVPYTKSDAIRTNAYNKLTIRKIDNSYFFYINEVFVHEMPFETFYGNVFGFKNSGNSTLSVDYMRICYLEKPKLEADNTAPQITILNPDISRGFKPVEQQKQVTISGKALDSNGIFEVLINGQEAFVDAEGNFSKTVLLAIGDNTFTISATDLNQNKSSQVFTIERKSEVQGNIPIVNNTAENTGALNLGKYYALIIGNNVYQDPAIPSLNEPINDATKLYNVLVTHYTFEAQNVVFLKNASYVQMIEAFDNLSNKITPRDNLLVFYAGHGWWDETKKLGYWLPADAKKSNTAFWIANSRISDYMGSINSKHTLLIADACFSGSIFKTRSAFADAQPAINKLYELPSKKAMTSGNLKEVPDKSAFLQFLVKRLQENSEKYVSSDILFASFRQAVLNNSPTEPQYGTIQNAGDEGGEFIFVRRSK